MGANEKQDKLKLFQVRIPEEVIRRIRVAAAARAINSAQVVAELVAEHLPEVPRG